MSLSVLLKGGSPLSKAELESHLLSQEAQFNYPRCFVYPNKNNNNNNSLRSAPSAHQEEPANFCALSCTVLVFLTDTPSWRFHWQSNKSGAENLLYAYLTSKIKTWPWCQRFLCKENQFLQFKNNKLYLHFPHCAALPACLKLVFSTHNKAH